MSEKEDLQDKDAKIQRLYDALCELEPRGSYNKSFMRGAGFVFMLFMIFLLLVILAK
jgi:hypothetical protein